MRGVVFNEVSGDFTGDAVDVTDLVTESHAIELVGVLEQFGSESCGDELGVVAELVDHVGDGFAMLGIERLIDFVEQVERGWIALLDSEDQRQSDQRFLTATQLVHLSHLCVASGEGNANADSSEVVRGRHFALAIVTVVVLLRAQHQVAGAVRNELLEDLVEVVGDLPEGELNRFHLAHFEVVHEFSVGVGMS